MHRDRQHDPADLLAAQRGDDRAWSRIHAHWCDTIFRWCARYGGPDIDAEDATQVVFMLLHQRAHTLAGPEVLPAWLHAVSFNVARDQRRARRNVLWDWLEPLWRAPRGQQPDARLERAELERDIAEVLGALSDDHQQVLVLCKLEGRSFSEAAALLGLPRATVASRTQRALERFGELARRRGLDTHLIELAPDDLLTA